MTDQTDTLINTFCFALALFYLLFQCLRLFYPKWALRFEGKYREVQERMRATGVFLSEKELMRAVPVDAAVRGLLKGNITDEPGILPLGLPQSARGHRLCRDFYARNDLRLHRQA